MRIAFFDIETTGTDIAKDKIIDIAIVRYDNFYDDCQAEKVEKLELLINPCCPITNSEIHGITDEMVSGAPTFNDVAVQIAYFIKGYNISGYNIKRFDIPLLMEEFARANVNLDISGVKIIDTFLLYKNLFPQTLSAAYEKYTGQKLIDAHRAMNDTVASELVFRGMIYNKHVLFDLNEIMKFQNGTEFDGTVDFAGKFIRKPDGKIYFNFGKHKDICVLENEYTISFLQWMCSKDFTEDTKKWANIFIDEYYKDVEPF